MLRTLLFIAAVLCMAAPIQAQHAARAPDWHHPDNIAWQVTDYTMDIGGAFDFNGTTFDLDPTGAYTLDMDTGSAVTLSIDPNLAAAYVLQDTAGADFLNIDTTGDTFTLGNATTNPAFTLLGSGTLTLGTGNITLTDATSITGGAAEVWSWVRTLTDSAAENGLLLTLTASDTGDSRTDQYGLYLDNAASTEGADALLVLDNSDTDDAVVSGIKFIDAGGGFTNEITLSNSETINNATDGTFLFSRNDTGIVTIQAADDDANADLGVYAGGTGTLSVGSTSGRVTFGGNATLAGDPAIGASRMDAGTTGLIFEGLTPDTNELLLTAADPGADITVTIPATTGTLITTGDSGTVTAGMVADITRTIPFSIFAFQDESNQALIDWSSGADSAPDYKKTSNIVAIEYDDTGGSVDANFIGFSFVVPQDYSSGGAIHVTVTQDAATGANIESIGARWSIDGAAISAESTTNLADQTAIQTVTVTPAGTLAAGSAVYAALRQANGSADDIVQIRGVEFRYTATQ